MATKKSTKKNTRKRGKRYLKKAARRTIAALLMVTALIVAAIPATPSQASSGSYTGSFKYTKTLEGSNTILFLNDADYEKGEKYGKYACLQLVAVSKIDDTGAAITAIELPHDFAVDSSASQPDDPLSNCIITEIGNNAMGADSSAGIAGSLTNFTGTDVVRINNDAFKNCNDLGACYLGDINYVGAHSFENTSITSLPITENSHITYIGDAAFAGSRLQNIRVPGPEGDQEAALQNEVFKGCTDLQTVRFTGKFNSIGDNTFMGCENFNSVEEWPEGITTIGKGTFEDCGENFTGVSLPSTITQIGENTFKNCKSLSRVRISNQITLLPSSTFEGCEGLLDVNIPGRIQTLQNDTFKDCLNLQYLHLQNTDEKVSSDPEHAYKDTEIQGALPAHALTDERFTVYGYRYYDATGHGLKDFSNAYEYCINNKIRYICITDEQETEDGFANEFYDVDTNGIVTNVLVDKILDAQVTPEGNRPDYIIINRQVTKSKGSGQSGDVTVDVKGIAGEAFRNTDGLKGIILQDNIENVYSDAFRNIGSLEFVEFANPNTTKVEDRGNQTVFPDNSGFYIRGEIALNTVDSGENAYEYASNYGIEFRGDVTDDGVTNTLVVEGNRTLSGIEQKAVVYKKLSELPDSVPAVSYIYIPEAITKMETDLVKGYDGITKFKSDGLEYIADYQFQNCDNLEDVSFNKNLVNIGKLPFQLCGKKLKSITIDEDNPYCYSDTDYGIVYAPVTTWSGNMEDIPNYRIVEAIEANDSTSYAIPKEVKSGRTVDEIDERAFQNRTAMRSFDSRLGQVKKIPENCFDGDIALTSIYLGSTISEIGEGAFQNMGDHDPAPNKQTPQIRVYNDYIQMFYKDADSIFDHQMSVNDTPYYFRSVSEQDNVGTMCNANTKDNLIWLGSVKDEDKKSISQCSIVWINDFASSGDTGEYLYDGNAVKLEPTDDSRSKTASFYVYDPDTKKTLAPNVDYTIENAEKTYKEIDTYPLIIYGTGGYDEATYAKSSFSIVSSKMNNKLGSISYIQQELPYSDGKTYDLSRYIIVKDVSGNQIDPKYYKLEAVDPDININNVSGTKNGTKTILFTATGDGINYNGTLNDGSMTIKDDSSSSSSTTPPSSSSSSVPPSPPTPDPGRLAGATIMMSGEIEYTGNKIDLKPVKSDTELNEDFQFLVIADDGTVLQFPTDFTYDPMSVRNEGNYVLTITGKGNYSPGTLTKAFTVKAQGSSSSSSSTSSSSTSTPASSLSVNLILNGPDRSAVSKETYKATNNFQYWNEGDPGIKSIVDRNGNALSEGTDYTIQSYGTVRPGIGKNTGYVQIQFKGNYSSEGRQNFYYDVKKDLSKNTSDDGVKSVTIQVSEATIDSSDKIEATVALTDSTTGTDLAKDTDYLQGSYKKTSDHHADVKVTGKGDKYVGTYTYNFRMEEKKSSSSSGKSSSSSSKGSSSSAKSSSSSSGTGGSSSSGGGSGGSGNNNSGTTVVNRNYYNSGNGGSVDELQDMLKAAHIDSINGGTADGYQVNITKSDAAEAAFREALLRRYGSLDNIRYFSMDIDVKDENGNDIDTTGMSVTLTLPLPGSMEAYGTNNKVATVDGNGDLEDLNVQFSTLEGRPCATFVAPHFSPYGFYVNTGDLAIGTLDNTPKTADPISPKWFISLGLAALSIFLFLKKDPKPRANAA